MAVNKETDTFLHENQAEDIRQSCPSKWWNQKFHSQEVICRITESWPFRVFIILLVIIDTALIIVELMLDSLKREYECERVGHHKKIIHRIESIVGIIHFVSIGILVFFVFELAVRIYANGREFWNFRRKKMEYLDAFIVITSLMVDFYCLHNEQRLAKHHLLIFFSIRLWRFVRIVSSVAEGVRDSEIKHKMHLNAKYLLVVNRLIELLKHKTNSLEANTVNPDLQSILEEFRSIDRRCQSSLDQLNASRKLTSSNVVNRFLNGINQTDQKESVDV